MPITNYETNGIDLNTFFNITNNNDVITNYNNNNLDIGINTNFKQISDVNNTITPCSYSINELIYDNNAFTIFTDSNSSSLDWQDCAMSYSGQYALASGTNSAIYYSSDYGQTWNISNSPTSASISWNALAMSKSGQY